MNISAASTYELFLGRWSRRLAAPLLWFAGFADTGDLIEIGCGTGSLALAMAECWPGRRIVGIDISEPYVSFARSRTAGGVRSAGPVLAVGDAAALPFADTSFAGCAAQLMLNFVPRPLDVAR